jgi:hypothetical protein
MTGELPKGLVPLPELGDDVVGTRVAESARWLLWAKAAVWVMLALVALGFAVQSVGFVAGLVLGIALALACGFMASGSLALALLGERPALTVDAATVRCLVPMNRAEIELPAITRVERIRHDLLIEARGGIARRGKPSRARWTAVHSAHTFEVSRADLVEYLSGRATASRAPRM